MLVDLSRVIESGMPAYPGDPVAELTPAAAQEPWRVTRLALGSHSGTHVDAAAHFIPGGRTIDDYELERFVLDAVVVPVAAGRDAAIGWAALRPALPGDVRGKAVLLHTGWDRHWRDEEREHHPYLSRDACERLVAAGVSLVGTDALNVDATAGATIDAHEVLLGADVLIVENLINLAALTPGRPCRCAFVPLRIDGGDGSPIRAYAWA